MPILDFCREPLESLGHNMHYMLIVMWPCHEVSYAMAAGREI